MAFYIFLGFTILWFLFMTYLSHQDGEHTGRTSRELAEKLSALDFLDSDINILNGRLRRLAHVVVYAVLTVLLAITLKLGSYSLWLTAGAIVWAWADEATKPLVQGRHFSWLDVGRNVLGIAIGMVIHFLSLRYFSLSPLQFICSVKILVLLAMCRIQRYYRHRSQKKSNKL